ncbi:hypothetical protein MLC52_09940 [Sulfurimonas sp. NW15]|uniref:hypothetical protein n=1 Tax=Sulfurimonas TaxID=202746 RepID=UPI00125FF090|nr:hypothetical protein [Sulfurimonas hydrogeniphila]
MFNQTKQTFDKEIKKFARQNIIKKLQKQGVDYTLLDEEEFKELIADEIKILKSDSKKVGAGIGIGILISLVTGI